MSEQSAAECIREQVTPAVVDALRAASDPVQLVRDANEAIVAITALRGAVASVKAEAVARMRANEMTWTDIGAALGVSGVRARAIAEGRER